jgi:hypothetical protein
VILLAYGCLVVVLAAFLIRGRGFRLSGRSQLLARLLGMIGAAATASIAVLLIAANQRTTLGLVVLLSLLSGSVLYLCGLALWHERSGFALRLIGWILAVSALAIPSTLTLLLPVACVLALTLRSAPEDQRLAIHATHH